MKIFWILLPAIGIIITIFATLGGYIPTFLEPFLAALLAVWIINFFRSD